MGPVQFVDVVLLAEYPWNYVFITILKFYYF